MDGFGQDLAAKYEAWCAEVHKILSNKAHLTYSEFSHVDRLGFIQPIVMTRHPAADHTLAMPNLKMKPLRDIIASHSLKA